MPLPEAGQKAPPFTAKDQNGNKVKLSDFKGRKLILYFYPADLTPTCTVQACNLRDNYKKIAKEGYTILGISPDDATRHQKFIDRHQLPFDLLIDPEHQIAKAYGVWGPKKMFGKEYEGIHRTTFLIDEKGKIEKVITKVRSGSHHEQILEV